MTRLIWIVVAASVAAAGCGVLGGGDRGAGGAAAAKAMQSIQGRATKQE